MSTDLSVRECPIGKTPDGPSFACFGSLYEDTRITLVDLFSTLLFPEMKAWSIHRFFKKEILMDGAEVCKKKISFSLTFYGS